ncbi:MAG: Colicin V production protein [Firmicutes bacterium ADurb.Bin182]|nr:MAG: Colicin V production protein [Firmicutes bacterium ADurb.Bin182]
MNLLDLAILAVFLLFVLAGLYRGFLYNAFCIGAYIISWILGMLLMPVAADYVKNDHDLMNMMLYYTEGSEAINDVELSRMNISLVSSDQLNEILGAAQPKVPFPMGERIRENIAKEAFSGEGITTLGEYFNQTIVLVAINIIVFIAIFMAVRLLLAFILNGVDYVFSLPVLRHSDALIAVNCGLIRGVLSLFLAFMTVPLILTVLPFEFIHTLIEDSLFGPFFYHSNFLLSLIPGV